MDKLVAPKDWRRNRDWFEAIPDGERKAFAIAWCNRLFAWEGQACVVISYPRSGETVAFYDLDGGEVHWVALGTVRRLLDTEFVRSTERSDFEWSAIQDHEVCDEASDIANVLFDER